MRSKILKRREKHLIKSIAQRQKKERSWGKYIYLIAISLLIAFTSKWGFEKIYYIKGVGFLEARTALVTARATGRIMQISCAINDTVKIGMPLVWLDRTDSTATVFFEPVRAEYYTNQRRIIDARRLIALLHERIELKQKSIKTLSDEVRQANELRKLNAILLSEQRKLAFELEKAKFALAELQIELKAALRTLQSYERQRTVLSANTAHSPYDIRGEETLSASQEGIISAVYKKQGEVITAGEQVLKITDTSMNYIKAYFEEAHEGQLKNAEEVTLKFENGDTSTGLVRKIYPVTSAQPPEIKHRFGKVRRFLIAEITPVEDQVWTRIHETQVTVFAKRKWL